MEPFIPYDGLAQHVAVCEHGTLGHPGCPAGVLQKMDIVG